MLQKTVTSIGREGTDPVRLTVNFADGTSCTFGTDQDVAALAQQLEHDQMWMALWAAYWYARNPTLTTDAIAVGQFTLDAGAANLFRKQ